MSRPNTLHSTRIEIAIALLAVGLTRRAVARHIGVPESTLRSALARDPELAERAAQARNLVEVGALQSILRAMSKSWRAAACFLQYTNPADYGRKRQNDPKSPAEYDDLAQLVGPNRKHRAPSGGPYQDDPDDDDWDDDDDLDDVDHSDAIPADEAIRQLNQLDHDRPLDPIDLNLAIDEPPTEPIADDNGEAGDVVAGLKTEPPTEEVVTEGVSDHPAGHVVAVLHTEPPAERPIASTTEPPNLQLTPSPDLQIPSSSAESAKSADRHPESASIFPAIPKHQPAFNEC